MKDIKNLYTLNKIMELKDEEIQDLKDQIEGFKRSLNLDLNYWQKERSIPVDDFRKDLPVPRLEMIHQKKEGYGSEWTYGIVRKAHAGMRSGWNAKVYNFTPLSQTTTSNLNLVRNGKINYPFRDSSHIEYDGYSLNMRVFLTCPELEIIEEKEISDPIKKQFNSDFN